MRHAFMLALAVGSVATAQAVVAQSGAALVADRPSTTADGATFTAPRGWTVTARGPVTVLAAPEGDLQLAVVDVPAAADGRAAQAAGWALYRLGPVRPVKLVTSAAARDGWDEREIVDYDVSPNERADIRAVALRHGRGWTVLITDGARGTAEKRSGALQLTEQSLRPANYTRESFAGRTPHRLDPARVAQMRAFVESAIRSLGVPGAGYALIDHGRIVFEGGAGVRELGKAAPVDAHTLFMIASNTKGMTTLLLAKLVDEGRLQWDQPVTQLYPSFRLGSDATTAKVLVRHLVCACTGLPRRDFDWIFNTRRDTPATTTFPQLAITQPTSGFGEVFQYNNLMASAAGYLGGHLVYPDMEIGAAYDRAMADKVFRPLGMTETIFDTTKALRLDHAAPHGADIDNIPRVAADEGDYIIAPYRPAGGAWSSAHDMALYVENELSRGVLPNGKRYVSEANVVKRREPNVPTGEATTYGMGIMTDETWGVPVVHHGGSMLGYKSDWVALPGADIGAVLLTNADDGGALTRPFMRRLLEVVYDGKPEAEGDVAAAAARFRAARAAERAKLDVPPAPAAAAQLAAAYTNADLGPLTITRDGDRLLLRTNAWSTHLASRRNVDGTTSFIATDPARLSLEFVAGGTPAQPTLTTRDGQHDYVFTKAGGGL